MVCLSWVPISEIIHKSAGSRDIHLFLHSPNNQTEIMLVWHLLVEHPFAAGFGQTYKAWRILDVFPSNCKDTYRTLVQGVQVIGEKATKKQFEEFMAFMKGFIGHIPFESGADDAEAGTELVDGLEDLVEIVSALENEKCVTSSQTGQE